MKIGKKVCLLFLMLVCLLLSGCRERTTGSGPQDASTLNKSPASVDSADPAASPDNTPDHRNEVADKKNDDSPGERTKENPDASRKEYDENASAEIVSGTDRKLHGPGEGNGAAVPDEKAQDSVNRLDDQAEETATQTVAAEQAEKKGVSEDASEADSAMTYYTVLLQDRMGSLFECQRLNVYWETVEDHVTVFKTSPEHNLILGAGAYDVSSRLLAENLHVDDGWICRKNPGVIVKTVNGSVLGPGVTSYSSARNAYAGLISRENWKQIDAVKNQKVLLLSEELLKAPHLQLAAMILIARTANPELFEDTDPDQTIEMLAEEATGSPAAGRYYYNGQGGF